MKKNTNGSAGPNLKNAAQNGGMSLTATLTTTVLLAHIKTNKSIQKKVAVEIVLSGTGLEDSISGYGPGKFVF
ncbi:unnamed protein product, partial [marine sediment metagenome]